jgi:hypothetical protein
MRCPDGRLLELLVLGMQVCHLHKIAVRLSVCIVLAAAERIALQADRPSFGVVARRGASSPDGAKRNPGSLSQHGMPFSTAVRLPNQAPFRSRPAVSHGGVPLLTGMRAFVATS